MSWADKKAEELNVLASNMTKKAIAEALCEERERCAMIAEKAVGPWDRREGWSENATPTQIAAAIRNVKGER